MLSHYLGDCSATSAGASSTRQLPSTDTSALRTEAYSHSNAKCARIRSQRRQGLRDTCAYTQEKNRISVRSAGAILLTLRQNDNTNACIAATSRTLVISAVNRSVNRATCADIEGTTRENVERERRANSFYSYFFKRMILSFNSKVITVNSEISVFYKQTLP